MITYEQFKINELEQEIFSTLAMHTDSQKLQNFELYKLVSREDIVNVLRDTHPDITILTDIVRNDQFADVEQQYKVLINVLSPKELQVVYELNEQGCDKTGLSIALNQYDLEFCEVTKLNYFDLLGWSYSGLYRADILFKRIILEALYLKATDLHFSVEHTEDGVCYPIYYRSGGILIQMDLFTLTKEMNSEMIRKFVEQKTDGLSLDLSNCAGVTTSVSGLFVSRPVELRVSANSVMDGLRCVIRIQEKVTTSLHIDELGFDNVVTEGIRELSEKRNGITFITGAVRTGKNTTAFAMANEMRPANLSLISYDSPIEVLMPFPQVDYRESPEILLNCVRLAKKQDIDIAFLNEIPSKDVAFAVKDLVNSSIGVVTTLHLDRIWDLPYRLNEYYGSSYKDVISQINGVVNQKMFGVNCPHCREKMKTYEIASKSIRDYLLSKQIQEVYVNKGCTNCFDIRTNNSGLIIGKNQPYAEFLIFTEELRSQLLKCDTAWEMSRIIRQTVESLEQDLEHYMLEGIKRGDLSYETLQYVL